MLAKPLSVALPTEEETWLLRSCLLSGEPGRLAWTTWLRHVGDPLSFLRQQNQNVNGLLPLLLAALRENDVGIDQALKTCLRTAYVQEELRSKLYNEIVGNVLSTLIKAGIRVILLNGADLAYTVYGNPVLRHCHGVNIIIKEDDLRQATSLMTALSFAPLTEGFESKRYDVEMNNPSGLQLVLHRRMFHVPFYNVAIQGIWERSQTQSITDVPTQVLSPADNLLNVCGHVFYAKGHGSLRWVCDSWFIIHRYPHLDWHVLLDCIKSTQLALPLSTALGYLAEHMDAPIPDTVLQRLHTVASQASMIGREVALLGARASSRGGFKRLVFAASDWRTRALIIKWIILPSPSFLRWVEQIRYVWLLPIYYVIRPLRYITRRIWLNCRGRGRPKATPGKLNK